jgi:hypothetical protein
VATQPGGTRTAVAPQGLHPLTVVFRQRGCAGTTRESAGDCCRTVFMPDQVVSLR